MPTNHGWSDGHHGHGCDKDDGKPRSQIAQDEIDQYMRATTARTCSRYFRAGAP